ncbi:hypothetical protein C7C46_12850 [Streptomyces tateyamensis]|uniref:Uncharacterized protein n=1 Tax=Streptomyces tateyamensis TaxID=565073 RepID=A0A2V4N7Z4_9ACTN|nr:hypothetical protein [Streptomyces tateyamensis]PYC80566.1 hypothetical protein C7C46_12850 [Streptomyces tateyamensis]
MLAGATVAQADTGITVQAAHNDWTNNGKLVLSLSAPTAVKDVKVSLYSMSTQQTVATVADFKLTSGTAENGTWENGARIQLPDLGSYRIDVSASDAGGDTLSANGAGYFYYSVRTNLNDTKVDRKTVDYQHRSVTISGHLMGQWPGSGAVTPMGGLTVGVSSYAQHTEVTTAADGSFSATLPVTDAYQNSIQASYSYDPNHVFYNQSSSSSFPITLKKTATKMVETPSTRTVPFQGTVNSTSTTLLWDSPTGWQPLAGKTVSSNSFGNYVQLTTDAGGNALFPATPPLWNNSSITVGWASDDLYLADAQASSTITVVQPAAFLSFAPTRVDAATVAVTGEMSFSGNMTPATIPVNIQFSATGKGGWTTVATAPSATWDGQGYGFSVAASSAGAGYWRATFTDAPQFQNAVSQVVYVAAP